MSWFIKQQRLTKPTRDFFVDRYYCFYKMSPLIFQPAAREFLLLKQTKGGPIGTQAHLCASVNGPSGVSLRAGERHLKALGEEGQQGR